MLWDDLDEIEQKALRQVKNGRVHKKRPVKSQIRARKRLHSLGLLEFDDRRWWLTDDGFRVLQQGRDHQDRRKDDTPCQ